MLATEVSAQQVFARTAHETGLLGDAHLKRKSASHLIGVMGGVRAERLEDAHLALAARYPDYTPDFLLRSLLERRTLVRTWGVRGVLQLVPTPQLSEYLAASGLSAPRWRRSLDARSNLNPAARMRLLKRLGPETLSREGLREAIPDSTTRLFMLREAAQQGLIVAKEGDGAQATFVWTQDWLGKEIEPERDVHGLVGRYLTAYGPVTAVDLAPWLGITVAAARTLMAKHRVEEIHVEGEETPTFMRPEDVESLVRTRKSQAKGIVVIPPGDPVLLATRTRYRVGPGDAENTGLGILDGKPVMAWTLTRGVLATRPLDDESHSRVRRAIEQVVERAGIEIRTPPDPA